MSPMRQLKLHDINFTTNEVRVEVHSGDFVESSIWDADIDTRVSPVVILSAAQLAVLKEWL